MAKKKKPKRFRAVTAVKAMARDVVGQPPPTRKAPSRRKRAEAKARKHKPTLSRMLREAE